MDQSSVTFNMLDPALPYSVAVGVVNNNITDGAGELLILPTSSQPLLYHVSVQ